MPGTLFTLSFHAALPTRTLPARSSRARPEGLARSCRILGAPSARWKFGQARLVREPLVQLSKVLATSGSATNTLYKASGFAA